MNLSTKKGTQFVETTKERKKAYKITTKIYINTNSNKN